MNKLAIVVFSDPVHGGEEALGRVLNALFLTIERQDKGQEVALVFQGTGTRWPALLARPDHPGHALYRAARGQVGGVCGACANVFGATEGAAATGLPLRGDRNFGAVEGVLDLSRYLDDGYALAVF